MRQQLLIFSTVDSHHRAADLPGATRVGVSRFGPFPSITFPSRPMRSGKWVPLDESVSASFFCALWKGVKKDAAALLQPSTFSSKDSGKQGESKTIEVLDKETQVDTVVHFWT